MFDTTGAAIVAARNVLSFRTFRCNRPVDGAMQFLQGRKTPAPRATGTDAAAGMTGAEGDEHGGGSDTSDHPALSVLTTV